MRTNKVEEKSVVVLGNLDAAKKIVKNNIVEGTVLLRAQYDDDSKNKYSTTSVENLRTYFSANISTCSGVVIAYHPAHQNVEDIIFLSKLIREFKQRKDFPIVALCYTGENAPKVKKENHDGIDFFYLSEKDVASEYLRSRPIVNLRNQISNFKELSDPDLLKDRLHKEVDRYLI